MATLDTVPSASRKLIKGMLLTTDPSLARAFQREITNCTDCKVSFDLHANVDEAMRSGGGPYQSVVIDLDGALAADEAVRIARKGWPFARVAVLTYWWSEQSELARDVADIVIHKPLRAAELRAFLRSPTGAPFGIQTGAEERALAAS